MTGTGGPREGWKLMCVSKLAIGIAAAVLGALSVVPAGETSPTPMLLGGVGPDQVLKIAPEWKMMHDAYAPASAAVETIRSAATAGKGELRLEVVFGSWCEDSLNHVPPLIKILEQVGKEHLPVDFFGVDRTKHDPEGKTAGWKIERVPTFIVTRKGIEIGRIVENPKGTLEADLAEILSPRGSR